MKRILAAAVACAAFCTPASAYKLFYAEQLYELYHRQLHPDSDSIMENIVWLEETLQAPFANPLYALARIETPGEWKHYQYLFKMHVNLLLVELHLRLGYRYYKQQAHFYNAPWRKQNLESLETAETLFRAAHYYWQQSVSWSRKLYGSPHHLEDVQQWEDDNYRIRTGDLDYGEIIGEHLRRLEEVRADFERMDENTY